MWSQRSPWRRPSLMGQHAGFSPLLRSVPQMATVGIQGSSSLVYGIASPGKELAASCLTWEQWEPESLPSAGPWKWSIFFHEMCPGRRCSKALSTAWSPGLSLHSPVPRLWLRYSGWYQQKQNQPLCSHLPTEFQRCPAFLAARSTGETRQRQAFNVPSFPLPLPLPLLVGYLFILLAFLQACFFPAGCTELGFQAISTC